MGMHRLEEIAATLVQEGRPATTPVAIIEWGCRPQQRTVVGTLADIAERARAADLGSPAVIIIGQVVALRERLAWVERKPLFGKRIVLTRAAEQSKELGDDLRELGADVLPFPTISIQPSRDLAPLHEALTHLERFDYLALTSPNGVAKTFEALDGLGLDARALANVKIAVIGPGTERALQKRFLRADLVAPEFRGEGLATAILDDWAKTTATPEEGARRAGGPRVLLPRARIARDALPRLLRAAGGVCEVVEAYETRAPEPSRIDDLRARLEAGTVDALTVTSSSTVDHLVRALGEDAGRLLAKTRVVSIGPITTETAQKLGVAVSRTATDYCLPGLVAALVAELSVSG
jgi:uroporphyrinogen III methyltransferase / synthase